MIVYHKCISSHRVKAYKEVQMANGRGRGRGRSRTTVIKRVYRWKWSLAPVGARDFLLSGPIMNFILALKPCVKAATIVFDFVSCHPAHAFTHR